MYLNKNDIKKFIYFYRTINKINNIIDIFIKTFKFNISNISISTSINVVYKSWRFKVKLPDLTF